MFIDRHLAKECAAMIAAKSHWPQWIEMLEHILHEADLAGQYAFGVQIDAALDEAYRAAGLERGTPRSETPVGR